MNYPTITLQLKREQSWIFGHPWIYSKALQKSIQVEPGSLVSVFDSKNQFLGIGTYHPKQTICIRMLTRFDEIIDATWFAKKFQALKEYRESILGNGTNAYRLCFGESDGIPGLVIDYYAATCSIQINSLGMQRLIPEIIKGLDSIGIKQCVFAPPSLSAKKEGVSVQENTPSSPIRALENNLQIIVPLQGGQKTGWFCDQRDNRAHIFNLSKNKSVLNLFSYTGGFSLAAIAGGASRIVSVDQDKDALELFKEMKNINGFTQESTEIAADVWQYLKEETETFDIVIVDPPAFVKEESKKNAGLKGYLDLFKMSVPRVKKGGYLLPFSCSHFVHEEDLEWVLRQVFAHTGRFFQTVSTLGQGFDHPVPVWFKEAKYLKGFLLKEL